MTPRQRKVFAEFIRQLVLAAGSLSLYSMGHRTTMGRAARALSLLNEAMADDSAVTLLFLGNELFVNGTPLEREPFADRFMRQAREYNIGNIVIERGATAEDIELLLRIITRQAPRDFEPSPGLRFGSVEVDQSRPHPGDPYAAIPSYSAIPPHMLQRLANAFEACTRQNQIDLDSVISLVAGFIAAFRNEANPLLALVPLREMNEHSFNQALNVCILNLAQGMALGIEGQLLHDIGIAAMLHDVGKMRVPKDLLAGSSSPEEAKREFLTQHTVRGSEYLLNTPGVPRIAVMTAFEHHMKYDRSGFPKVTPEWQINLCSHMTMISLCFDTIRTKRIYQGTADFEKTAGAMLQLSGTALHPALTLNFLRVLRKMEEDQSPASLSPSGVAP